MAGALPRKVERAPAINVDFAMFARQRQRKSQFLVVILKAAENRSTSNRVESSRYSVWWNRGRNRQWLPLVRWVGMCIKVT